MRALPLLLAALVLAGTAAAQGPVETGRVTAAWAPAGIDVPQGAVGVATLRIESSRLQPVVVTLEPADDARFIVVLNRTEVTLPPLGNATVAALVVPAAGLSPGNRTLRVNVHVPATGLDEAETLGATLSVRTTTAAPPVGSPLLSHRTLPEARVALNETANLTLTVRHASWTNQSFRLRAFLPRGWAVTAPPLDVDPNETLAFAVSARPLAGAANGTARLVFENAANATRAGVVDLPLVVASRAPPPDPGAGGDSPAPPAQDDPGPAPPPEENATTPADEPAGNATGNATTTTGRASNATSPPPADTGNATREDNATSPPPNSTQDEATTSNPPPPAQDEADADPEPLPAIDAEDAVQDALDAADVGPEPEPARPDPPAAGVRLRVEPALVRLAPGSVADARLILESDADASVRVRLVLPPGLAGSVSTRAFAVHAGEPLEIPFLLQADPGLANGSRLDARAEAPDRGADPARFVVLVEDPAPPVELVSLSAPGSAGGQSMRTSVTLSVLAACVGAGALLWTRRRWLLAFAALYARIRPSAVLEHPVRQRIAAFVQQNPGVTMREAQRGLDLANGAMTYHLRTLERAGLVRVVPDGMLRRIYPAGHPRVDAVPPLSERVLLIVGQRGEATPKAIAEALGVSRQSVHYHLQKMVRDGTLRARVEGRETFLRKGEPEAAPARGATT